MDKKSELDFVDKDIADYFFSRWPDDTYWVHGHPTQMQLARYIKRLCELMENAEKSKER